MTTKTTLKDLKARVNQYAQCPDFHIIDRRSRLERCRDGYTINGIFVGATINEVSDTLDVMLYANCLENVVHKLWLYCNTKALPYCFVNHTNESIKTKLLSEINAEIKTYTNPEYVGDLPNLIKAREKLLNM